MQQAAALTDLDDKPLVVVTADTGNAAGWEQAQDRMATLSTNSSHRVAKDTTHASLLYDEADSAQASRQSTTSSSRYAPPDHSPRADAPQSELPPTVVESVGPTEQESRAISSDARPVLRRLGQSGL